jgi:hypothetical protein
LVKTLYNTRIKQLINGYYMNYLPVDVYRSAGQDCTLNGVTATDQYQLVVACEDGHISEEDIDNSSTPVVVLILGSIMGHPHFKPETQGNQHSMMGGNFVYSCDSRFRRTYGGQPVAVHDRFES